MLLHLPNGTLHADEECSADNRMSDVQFVQMGERHDPADIIVINAVARVDDETELVGEFGSLV